MKSAYRSRAQIQGGIVLAMALGLAGVFGSDARADDAGAPSATAPVPAEVLVLYASGDGSGIDPQIGRIPALAQPPFSAYSGYKLLSRSNVSLAKGTPATTSLPSGQKLSVSLEGIVPATKIDPTKYVVSATLQKPDAPLLKVTTKAGDPFFVMGQAYKDGVLVIGIRVLP